MQLFEVPSLAALITRTSRERRPFGFRLASASVQNPSFMPQFEEQIQTWGITDMVAGKLLLDAVMACVVAFPAAAGSYTDALGACLAGNTTYG
jgi:hypothetical protein